MDAAIIFCAKYLLWGMGLVALACFAWLPRDSKLRLALAALVALPLAYGLARLLGALYSHPQPFFVFNYEPLVPHEVDNSFPSDHAAMAGALAGVVSLFHRFVGLCLWVLALGVAGGRMLAGLHYPVDVVVGLVLGGLCAAVASLALHFYFSAQSHT